MEGIKAGSNGGNVCFADGMITATSTQFTGGDATRGGAVAVGVTAVATLDGCTVETAYGSTDRCIYISAGGNLTLKDGTVKNLTDSGTAVWCCGTLNLQGTVDIPEGNMDMMLDARNESGAVIDISGLTKVDEAITIRRYELDSEDDDYDAAACGSFSGTVNGQIASVAHTDGTYGSSVKYYVVLKDVDGVYTAHRFVAAITHMSLKPSTVAPRLTPMVMPHPCPPL